MTQSSAEYEQWQGYIEYVAVTDIGMRRTTNQDAYAVVLASDHEAWGRRGHLFVVADGMGAHAAGELASKLAADGVANHYLKRRDQPPWDALRASIEQTNSDVYARGQANLDFFNMGTTVSVLLLLPQGSVVGHVGDSRVYRQRGDRLDQLTFDHSLVWELQAAGHTNAGEEGSGIPKNIITRSLGPNANVQVDLEGPFSLRPDDVFMLCSDGLTGLVTDEEIGTIIASLPIQSAAQILTDLANLRGGPDNITVVMVRVIQDPPQEARAIRATGADQERKVAPAWYWIGIAIAGLLALVSFGLEWDNAAIILGAITATGLLGGGMQWILTGISGDQLVQRLGRGPYRSVACKANQSLVERLHTIVRQLHEVADENEWDVNRDTFLKLVEEAVRATAEKDYDQALRQFGEAIHCIMQDLRDSRGTSTDT